MVGVTAKEQREMQRLRNRIAELEAASKKQFRIYADNLAEVVTLRTALLNARDCLAEAMAEVDMALMEQTTKGG